MSKYSSGSETSSSTEGSSNEPTPEHSPPGSSRRGSTSESKEGSEIKGNKVNQNQITHANEKLLSKALLKKSVSAPLKRKRSSDKNGGKKGATKWPISLETLLTGAFILGTGLFLVGLLTAILDTTPTNFPVDDDNFFDFLNFSNDDDDATNDVVKMNNTIENGTKHNPNITSVIDPDSNLSLNSNIGTKKPKDPNTTIKTPINKTPTTTTPETKPKDRVDSSNPKAKKLKDKQLKEDLVKYLKKQKDKLKQKKSKSSSDNVKKVFSVKEYLMDGKEENDLTLEEVNNSLDKLFYLRKELERSEKNLLEQLKTKEEKPSPEVERKRDEEELMEEKRRRLEIRQKAVNEKKTRGK